MAVGGYLADTSALGRRHLAAVAAVLEPLIQRGMVVTCPLLDLEMGYVATSSAMLDEIRADRQLVFGWVPMPDQVWARALQVQQLLVGAGTHRGVGIPDLLIAATAEAHGLTVLHYDHDFELIADVTQQPVAWVAPRGSLP